MSRESALQVVNPSPAPEVTAPAVETQASPESLASTQFAKLSKREAQIVRMQQDLKKEKEHYAGIKTKYDAWEATKKTDPIAAIKDLGFTEQDIFNYLASNDKPEPTADERMLATAEQVAAAKIKEYQDSQDKKLADEKAKQDQVLVEGYKSEIGKAVKSNPEKFEYCAYNGKDAETLAYQLTLEVLKESKGQDILTPLQALELAEGYFEEEHTAMNSLKKYQAKSAPVEKPTQASPGVRERTVTPGYPNSEQPKADVTRTRTVLNTTPGKTASNRNMHETREEKKARLIAQVRAGRSVG